MYKSDEFNKKEHILKILKGFPKSFTADLLEKLPDSGFKRGDDSPDIFLKEKLNEPEFAANFMKLFDDYAKDEFIKELLQDNPKYLMNLLQLPGKDTEVDPNNVKITIQEKLNREDGGEAFISSFENAAGNGRMHIFFYKIVGTEQLKELEKTIEKLEKLQSEIEEFKNLQSKIKDLRNRKAKIKSLKYLRSNIEKLKKQIAKIENRKDHKSKNEKSKNLEAKIKKLEHLKSQIENLKDLQSKIDELEDQQSKIKNLKYLQSMIEKLDDLKLQIKNLKALQSKIDAHGDLQSNIDKLLKGIPNVFLWWAAQPVLVSVERRKNNGRNEVWFKWVESRLWNERRTDLTVSPTPFFARRMERSVSYFIVDPDNRTAQLRIQQIRPNALKSLKNEYKQFMTEIDKLLGFFHFSRIPMEAVVKEFLSHENIEPLTWEMQLPDGAYFSAKGKPELFFSIFRNILILRKIGMGVINRIIFFGRKLSCEFHSAELDWSIPEVRIKVDGEKDVLTILNECELQQMKTILDTVLKLDKNEVTGNILNTFLDGLIPFEGFLFERIVLSFDYHFTRLKDSEIRMGHIEDSEWLQKEIVENAVIRLSREYPENFVSKGKGRNRVLKKIEKKKKGKVV
ncbi:MAG: hypothetical protein KAW12_27960 [Candidatus Aminicenantes bacterium]|nr:hypothetical protein [Candidatus Aminicenantes bacterium]